MSTPLFRIFEAAQCRTQVELAHLLGIRQSSISDAKRRNSVPAEWLVTLLRLRGVNPDWILNGVEPKYLSPTNQAAALGSHTNGRAHSKADTLRGFSSRDLADELLRRISASAEADAIYR